jgi:antirestriction protein ArdC
MATPTTESRSAVPAVPEKRDFRQEVTDRIVNMLEEGVAPWQKPWNPGEASVGIPFNPTTERGYRGGNAVHLMATGLQREYGDPRWMTYKQAADQGWQVRRGEKGTQIEFWDVRAPRKEESRPDATDGRRDGDDEKRATRLVHRVYTVFNANQIEGIPPYESKRPTPFEVVQSGEKILDNSGARVQHDQADRAFYSRSSDSIHLPPKDAFKDAAGYYGTALHELAHWTGHPSRLDRATLNESYRFGDSNYAKEELRAELASVFLAAERGIPHDPAQHAAYVGSWVKALREDKNEIFRAAHDASAATEFILALERDRSIADESIAAGPSIESSGSRAAVLEEETARLERDREDEMEMTAQLEADHAADRTSEATARESSQYVARVEPGSGTVNLEEKQTGTERRSTVEMRGAPAQETSRTNSAKSDEFEAARAITANALGESARTVDAVVDGGTYRGVIIGETERHLLQRQSAGLAVLHPKELLDRQLQVGEVFAINYSNGRGMVRDAHDRGKAQELGR